jgi:hypothetical protein
MEILVKKDILNRHFSLLQASSELTTTSSASFSAELVNRQ